MTGRTKKMSALVGIAAAAALTFGTVGTHAVAKTNIPAATDADDSYVPANTVVLGTSTSTVFTVGPITVTCTHSTAGGKTKATGLGAFTLSPLPVFNDGTPSAPCTDTVGATDTTTTSGVWKLAFKDSKAAGEETGTEPNSGDKLQITVPIGGAVVHNSFGCVITVAPTAAFKVTGSYDDVNKLTISIANLPIKVTGPAGVCPLSSPTSAFTATYIFSPNLSDGS